MNLYSVSIIIHCLKGISEYNIRSELQTCIDQKSIIYNKETLTFRRCWSTNLMCRETEPTYTMSKVNKNNKWRDSEKYAST